MIRTVFRFEEAHEIELSFGSSISYAMLTNIGEPLILKVGFANVDESDTACGLLRCIDPYYMDFMDVHPLKDWRPYHT